MPKIKTRNATPRFYAKMWNANPCFIDLIEERDGFLHGYEFKWNAHARAHPPELWKKTYPNATFETIHPQNYQNFILPQVA